MYVESACFDPNILQEGLAEDDFSETLPDCNTSFTMEDLSYHQNPPQGDASAAVNGAAMEIELQQQLGLDMDNLSDTHLMQQVVRDPNQVVLPYDQPNWEISVHHDQMQEMSFSHNNNPHHQEDHFQHLGMQNGPHQNFNNSSVLQDTQYPQTPDLLNLFNLPRCSPSSVLPNSSSLSYMNPAQKLGFLGVGDLPSHDSAAAAAQASNVVYDPLFHLNLPPQPPIFRELFQSLPHGYNLAAGSRTAACSLFGGGVGVDEREARGDVFQDGEERNFENNGIFEFTGDMNCVAKGNGKGTDKHFATEKQRRQHLNGKYEALKLLVPNPTKADRASVVGDAIEYIKELLRTVNELKLLVEKKRCGRERMKRHKTEEDGANGEFESPKVKPEPEDQSYNGSSLRSSWLQRKSKDTEVDVRIIDDEVTIKLAQRKKINCLLIVSKVLDELLLDIQHVAGGLVGDSYSFLFNSKICEGSSVYASAIANKLIEVVDRQYAAIPPTRSY